MMITQKGQVTIPAEIRNKFGFLPHTEIEFVIEENKIVIKKKDSPFKKLKGIAQGKFTTQEIMELTRKDDIS